MMDEARRTAVTYLGSILEDVRNSSGMAPSPDPPELWAQARSDCAADLQGLVDPQYVEAAMKVADEELALLDELLSDGVADAYSYWLMVRNRIRVEKTLDFFRKIEFLKVPEGPDPVAGWLPHTLLHASARKVPASSMAVVLMNYGLKATTNSVAKALVLASTVVNAQSPKPKNREELAKVLPRDSPPAAWFRNTLLTYAAMGMPFAAPAPLPGPLNKVGARFETAMDLFALAHEYAHVVRGHLEHPAGAKGEFEADRLGMDILMMATKDEMPMYVEQYAGVVVLFTMQQLVRRMLLELGAHQRFTDQPADYPTVEQRIDVAKHCLIEGTGGDQRATLASATATIFREIIFVFYDYVRDDLADTTLADVWTSPAPSYLT